MLVGEVDMEEVPAHYELGPYCFKLCASWVMMMAKEGSKTVPLAGLDDKRQITAVFGATLDDQFLPPQIIYQSKTEACLRYLVRLIR